MRRLATIALLLLMTQLAHADIESEAVRRGVAAYDQIDFASAIKTLDAALKESLTREEKVVACRTLAFAHAGLGHYDEARAAFVELLRVEPTAELDKRIAPRLRALFEEARVALATGKVEVAPARLPGLTPTVTPARPREGQAVAITISHPGGMASSLQLYHRIAGEPAYRELVVAGQAGRFTATLPTGAVRMPGVEFYVTALDDQHVAIARAGSFGAPIQIEVAGKARPLYKRPWVWAVVAGVVAVGTATGLAVGLTRGSSNPNSDVQLIAPR